MCVLGRMVTVVLNDKAVPLIRVKIIIGAEYLDCEPVNVKRTAGMEIATFCTQNSLSKLPTSQLCAPLSSHLFTVEPVIVAIALINDAVLVLIPGPPVP